MKKVILHNDDEIFVYNLALSAAENSNEYSNPFAYDDKLSAIYSSTFLEERRKIVRSKKDDWKEKMTILGLLKKRYTFNPRFTRRSYDHVFIIGYNHLAKGEKTPYDITKDEAEKFLEEDVNEIKTMLTRKLQVDLNENQISALILLIFDVGIKTVLESKILDYINDSRPAEMTMEWKRLVFFKNRDRAQMQSHRLEELVLYKNPAFSA